MSEAAAAMDAGEAFARLGLVEAVQLPEAERARAIVARVAETVARRVFPPEPFAAGYLWRSPEEVLGAGAIHFTAPCADLSGTCASLLRAAGLDVTLVLGAVLRSFVPAKLQCGLEVRAAGERIVVGFGPSSSYFYPGEFLPTRRRPFIYRRRLAAPDLARPFLAHFGLAARGEVARFVPGYQLDRDVRDHIRASSARAYEAARRTAERRAAARRPEMLPLAGTWPGA